MHRTFAIASWVILAALVVGVVPSCTLLTDFNECSTSSDCVATLGARATCEDKLCVVPAEITGGTCTRTVGTVDSPRGLLIGVLLPLTGDEAGFGLPLLNAVELAWGNFDQIGGVGDRPIGLLICDTEGKDDVALEAGRHLVEVAKVGAIIGPDFSSQTIDVATQYAIPNDVLLVTPSGTAASITDLDDKNLVWRTAPSDTAQAAAIAQLVEHHVTQVQGKSLSEAVVWLLTRADDPYSDGLQQGLIEGFPAELTNSANFHPSVYPDDWSDTWFTATALGLPAPDVVLIMGAAESWDIAEAIDDAFDSTPTFFFPDAARNPDEASISNVALEGRILGTAPQAIGDIDYVPYTTFKVKYQGEYETDPNQFQFVANAYDALHVVALAAAGGGGVTGPELAVGMGKLSSGTPISANSQDAQKGIRLLAQGDTIDFQGASGRLDFDVNGDPSPSAIALWCFANGAVPEVGDLLATTGEFTPLDCSAAANNTTIPDMGTPDMGMADIGIADTGSADMAPGQ